MKLEELFPGQPTFTLKSTGKEYHLRIANLEDRARFTEILGGDQKRLGEILERFEWQFISKLVYRVLVEKSDFQAIQESYIDDNGVAKNDLITGPSVFMRACIGGTEEALRIINALIQSIRLGDPILDKAMNDIPDKDKKKQTKSIGPSSSTSSVRSTATPQSSSVASP